jgi:hypothetical protein
MRNELSVFQKQVNFTRFHNQTEGHYESFFLRANHPARPLAFWIRYTIFSPKNNFQKNIGELWAVFFNGESNRHTAVKKEYPLAACHFDTADFNIRVGTAKLASGFLKGAIKNKKNSIAWDMKFGGDSTPLLLLPLKLYKGKFPAAKSLVSLPLARFRGILSVNNKKINITDWVGSQNHNWGSRHTDLYAWGQVAGFDTHPDSFLEVATAKIRLGPVWSPPITLLVLRHNNKEYALTKLIQGIRAHGRFKYFTWEFISKTKDIEINGHISAPIQAFAGLNYYNPPGGNKNCLNTKIAECRVIFKNRKTGKTEILETKHRAAFEILTDDTDHGIIISA